MVSCGALQDDTRYVTLILVCMKPAAPNNDRDDNDDNNDNNDDDGSRSKQQMHS